MSYVFEAELTAEKRKKIPESQFGIPEERKYPLHDAAHVRSAIAYFHKAPNGKKKALAARIKNAANKFNIEINPDSDVAKYL